jgi:hypothetical protein
MRIFVCALLFGFSWFGKIVEVHAQQTVVLDYYDDITYRSRMAQLKAAVKTDGSANVVIKVGKDITQFRITQYFGEGKQSVVFRTPVTHNFETTDVAIRLPYSVKIHESDGGFVQRIERYREAIKAFKVAAPQVSTVDFYPSVFPGQGKYYELVSVLEGKGISFEDFIRKILDDDLLPKLLESKAPPDIQGRWNRLLEFFRTTAPLSTASDLHPSNLVDYEKNGWTVVDLDSDESILSERMTTAPAKAVRDRSIAGGLMKNLGYLVEKRGFDAEYLKKHKQAIQNVFKIFTNEIANVRATLKLPTYVSKSWKAGGAGAARIASGFVSFGALYALVNPRMNHYAHEVGISCDEAKKAKGFLRCEMSGSGKVEVTCDYLHSYWENPKDKRACGALFFRTKMDWNSVRQRPSEVTALKRWVTATQLHGIPISIPKGESVAPTLETYMRKFFPKSFKSIERIFYDPDGAFSEKLKPNLMEKEAS